MSEIERTKGSSLKIIMGLLIIVLIVLGANFSKIQNLHSKNTTYKSKKVTTVTKEMNLGELIMLENEQIQLSKKYDKRKNEWLHDEIHSGARSMIDHSAYMSHHSEYDSAKVKFSLVTYKFNGKIVEFLTNPKIIQVHSESGWKDK